jgi:hypothetical protein
MNVPSSGSRIVDGDLVHLYKVPTRCDPRGALAELLGGRRHRPFHNGSGGPLPIERGLVGKGRTRTDRGSPGGLYDLSGRFEVRSILIRATAWISSRKRATEGGTAWAQGPPADICSRMTEPWNLARS